MMEGGHAAVGPFEALLGVPQIAHDVSVFPAALLGTWSAQVAGRWWAVVNGTQSTIRRTFYFSRRCVGAKEGGLDKSR